MPNSNQSYFFNTPTPNSNLLFTDPFSLGNSNENRSTFQFPPTPAPPTSLPFSSTSNSSSCYSEYFLGLSDLLQQPKLYAPKLRVRSQTLPELPCFSHGIGFLSQVCYPARLSPSYSDTTSRTQFVSPSEVEGSGGTFVDLTQQGNDLSVAARESSIEVDSGISTGPDPSFFPDFFLSLFICLGCPVLLFHFKWFYSQ